MNIGFYIYYDHINPRLSGATEDILTPFLCCIPLWFLLVVSPFQKLKKYICMYIYI